MESKASNKITRAALAVLAIVVIILSTVLYLQGKQISKIKHGFEDSTRVKKSSSKTGKKSPSALNSYSPSEEEKYKQKINQLETRLAEMQEWSDSLEETLNEYDEKADAAAVNPEEKKSSVRRINNDEMMRRSYISQYKDFFEENNFPPEVLEKFADLYLEKQNAVKELYENARSISKLTTGNGSVTYYGQEVSKKSMEIRSEYDKKIEDLLTKEGFDDLKEYEKTQSERFFVREFKRMLGDEKLEKEQEKRLIALMYDDRQASYQVQRNEKVPSYVQNGGLPNEEEMKRMQEESVKRNKKLYEDYAESAKGILSESQMQKFEGYINMQKDNLKQSLMYSRIIKTDTEEKKDDQ